MDVSNLISDLRSRINAEYAHVKGTESYERRLCAEALEMVSAENERLRSSLDALLGVAEQVVDTRRCTPGILRAMNSARQYLKPNAEVTGGPLAARPVDCRVRGEKSALAGRQEKGQK